MKSQEYIYLIKQAEIGVVYICGFEGAHRETSMLSVGTNYGGLFSAKAAKNSQLSMNTSIERLSTGKRINNAKDDAAGLSVSARLINQIKSISAGTKNLVHIQNFSKTMDAAMQEVTTILLRTREIAVAAANDTLNASDRTALDSEVTQLEDEIISIGNKSEFAGFKLFQDYSSSVMYGPSLSEVYNGTLKSFSTAGLSRSGFLQGNVLTKTAALSTINLMDAAISMVSTNLGSLASDVNWRDRYLASLEQFKINLSSSNGKIQDADFAIETASLARAQILQQSSIAMLAQANSSKISVLTLIQLE